MSLLSAVTRDAPQLPSRVVLYAPEKAGKTSFGCYAPNPIFLMTAGETGLLSLIEAGQVPPTAHFPDDFKDWGSLLGAVQALGREDHQYKTLVLDTGNGAEQMLLSHVCGGSPFDGNWNEFNSYGRGVAAAVPLWAEFLRLLDDLRTRRRMAVLFLHHSRVKSFQNPAGKDWDQWKPEAVDKLWGLTHKWADVIAFFGSRVQVSRDDKAVGAEQRFLRCAPAAAIVAGNRYGMPEEITAPPGAKNLWAAFAKALQGAKAKAREQQATAPEPTPAEPMPAKPHQQPQAREQQPPPANAGGSGEPAGDADPEPAQAPAKKPAAGLFPNTTTANVPPPGKPETDLILDIVTLGKELGLDWEGVRERYGYAVGIPTGGPPFPVSNLSAAHAAALKQRLAVAVADHRRAAAEAGRKQRRQAEATEGVA